ncbi:flagellin [Streptomyces lavendulae]|uniref:flagellin n=1 Tax=Streptomyces lavendulae TaxID=1914 RepID=UPI003813C240
MIDSALVQVASLRSILGAVRNRFESSIRSQDTGVVNLSSARKRIETTNYALEAANHTQASILQKAGISVLAQVNAQPKNILPLSSSSDRDSRVVGSTSTALTTQGSGRRELLVGPCPCPRTDP